jgi:hypothetical protein
MKLFKFLCVMVSMAHICACLWMGIALMNPCWVPQADLPVLLAGNGISVECSPVQQDGTARLDWLVRYDQALAEDPGRPESKCAPTLRARALAARPARVRSPRQIFAVPVAGPGASWCVRLVRGEGRDVST